jgi:hypothetical protein
VGRGPGVRTGRGHGPLCPPARGARAARGSVPRAAAERRASGCAGGPAACGTAAAPRRGPGPDPRRGRGRVGCLAHGLAGDQGGPGRVQARAGAPRPRLNTADWDKRGRSRLGARGCFAAARAERRPPSSSRARPAAPGPRHRAGRREWSLSPSAEPGRAGPGWTGRKAAPDAQSATRARIPHGSKTGRVAPASRVHTRRAWPTRDQVAASAPYSPRLRTVPSLRFASLGL